MSSPSSGLLALTASGSLPAQSTSLPTDRARVSVTSIPDAYDPAGPEGVVGLR